MSEEQDQRANGPDPDGDSDRGKPGGAPSPAAPSGESTTEPMEQRLAALEAERNDTRERMLRIAAEFENYKKRVKREMVEADSKAREAVLRDMLEVIDNLERAVSASNAAGGDPKALQQGVQLVLRLFQSKLERHDVKPFEAKGQPFDPRLHDAISQLATADVPPGSVVNEVQRGYRIGDRLLRPAMVAVATSPLSKTPPPVSKTPPPTRDGNGDGDGNR
jgi:molecular chaperone GrpE